MLSQKSEMVTYWGHLDRAQNTKLFSLEHLCTKINSTAYGMVLDCYSMSSVKVRLGIWLAFGLVYYNSTVYIRAVVDNTTTN